MTAADQTFTHATGTLTGYAYHASTGVGTISYSYTLIDNTLTIVDGHLRGRVTDNDGDSTPAGTSGRSPLSTTCRRQLRIPTALPRAVHGRRRGNVLTGGAGRHCRRPASTLKGADGAVVSGLPPATPMPISTMPATLNTAIQGAYGKLTLLADGSLHLCARCRHAWRLNDVFTYTIKDGDGDLSHTTLTISIGDSTPTDMIPAAGGATTTVYEKGLAARGGEPAGSGEIADGTPNNSDRRRRGGDHQLHLAGRPDDRLARRSCR